MDPICREMVTWKSISGIVPALNNPGKLGRTRQGVAGSSWGRRNTVEKQSPDAAWISWEFYKNIPIFFDLKLLLGCPLGLPKSPRPALLVPASCSPEQLPPPGKIQPGAAPGFGPAGGFSSPPRGQDPSPHLAKSVPTSLSQAPGAAGGAAGSILLFSRSSILKSSPHTHCIPRVWERFGVPQLIPGNAGSPREGTWAEHTWSRGGWHVPGGIIHLGQENQGCQGSLGLF